MLNLGVLDTAIAMVVVILLLSLIVQSVQTFLKKLTRFKSRQIAKSLEKLFTEVPQPATTTPAQMKDDVLAYFKRLGRVSLFGKEAIESLSKADLSKIVAAVQASHLLPPEAMSAVERFYDEYKMIPRAIEALGNVSLSADAQAKMTQLVALIIPIDTQISHLFQEGRLDPKAVARDILALRGLDTTPLVTAAAELQKSIEQASAADPANAVLKKAAADASALAQVIGNVNMHVVNTTAQLKQRLGALESWFDTVMQGFEERYARHMRSWSFVIGLTVAIVMNANVVQLYQHFSSDDIERQRVMAKGAAIQEQYTKKIEATPNDPNLIDGLKADLKKNAETYTALGLKPIDADQWAEITKTGEGFAMSVAGWLIMAFLLSLGAPFWHDALQSLFGVKNLLRQKGEVQNIEQKSGQGMTQSS